MQVLRLLAYGTAAVLKALARFQVGFADMLAISAERLERWADERRRDP